MRETWYVLEDGTAVDPAECASDEKGRLTHRSGAKIAMRFPDCPMSKSVDPKAERAKAAVAKNAAETTADPNRAATSPEDREMKAEEPKKAGYKTRAVRAN